ncbi:MAG TPA: hypothetical protein DCG57_06460 [Candidatus Riflebacteria bacterium]|nr:hypothetical protein [Candidatus Riflebacteria bacterium]
MTFALTNNRAMIAALLFPFLCSSMVMVRQRNYYELQTKHCNQHRRCGKLNYRLPQPLHRWFCLS